MKKIKRYSYALILPLALLVSSCSNNSTKADEPEIASMDSVSTELEKSNKALEEKAKALEASLEKADKELETAK